MRPVDPPRTKQTLFVTSLQDDCRIDLKKYFTFMEYHCSKRTEMIPAINKPYVDVMVACWCNSHVG